MGAGGHDSLIKNRIRPAGLKIPEVFIKNAIAPAKILDVEINQKNREAKILAEEDQLSLAIGKNGQNVRLAAKLTGYKIDIRSRSGESVMKADESGEIEEDKTESV